MNRRERLLSVMALPGVRSVQIAQLGPSDVVVVSTAERLSPNAKERMCEALSAVFPDNKICVLDVGTAIEVIRA